MNEDYFLRCRVWAAVGWGLVLGLFLASWTVMLFDGGHWRVAGMLAATGCASSAVAATLHIRSFMVRMTALIRVAHRLDLAGTETESLGLYPVR